MISSHIDDVVVASETDNEYKVMVLMSIPKVALKRDVKELIEGSTIHAMIEIDADGLQDHIKSALDLSPRNAAMIEYDPSNKKRSPLTPPKINRKRKP